MEFYGKVELLPARKGTSQRTGNEWVAYPMVIKDPNGTQEIFVEAFGDDRMRRLGEQGLCEGSVGTLTMYVTTEVYDGRRFNKISPVRWAPQPTAEAPKAEQAQVSEEPAKEPEKKEEDGLPF